MNLLKTSIANGLSVLFKIGTLLGINKVLAIYVGPGGYAAIGQFQNAVQIITAIAGGAFSSGVTRYTAEYAGHEEKLNTVWRTAFMMSLFASLLFGVLIFFYDVELSRIFFNRESFSGIFRWFAFSLVLFSINILFLAILNGKKEIYGYVLSVIAGSLLALILTGIFSIYYGLYGALVAFATYQSIGFLVTLIICLRYRWFSLSIFWGYIDKEMAWKLLAYSAMTIVSAACVPLSHIVVRDYLHDHVGLEFAGYWEAMMRLSSAYLMFITTTLSVYFLPRLAELNDAKKIKSELVNGYKLILPTVAVFSAIIYFLRDLIIYILFSDNFIQMRELFGWQVIGDVMKIGGWMMGYTMIAKGLIPMFVVTEIIFTATFLALSIFCVNEFGFLGTAIAHAINYFLYWITTGILVFRWLNSNR